MADLVPTRRSRRLAEPGASSNDDSRAERKNSLDSDSPEKTNVDDLWNSFLSDDTEKEKASNDKSDQPQSEPSPTENGQKTNKLNNSIKKSGIGSVLNQVQSRKRGLSSISDIAALTSNKIKKPSVIEQTKNDWDTFKTKEGLSEELSTFNSGKAGFLQRRDFLERTDLRQFEIEKELRAKERSKRGE